MKKFYLLALLCTCFSLSLFANGIEIDGIYYLLNNTDYTASVTYTSSSIHYNSYTGYIVIPSSVEYNSHIYSVTNIDDFAFSGCSSLTSVTIPNSVTNIGDGAFYDCTGLTSVTIPNSVTSIGRSAFSGCSSLTSVIIPNSVTSIGSSAFSGCNGFTSIEVEAGNTIYDSRNQCNAIIETTTNTLIAGCKNTTIPNSVTSIGNYAFAYCSSLTSVTIPNSVTRIGDWAFQSCMSLTSVTIPNSVISIGEFAFGFGLTAVHISDLTAWCEIVIDTTMSNPLYYAHNLYLNGELVTDLVIPNDVSIIKEYAFEGGGFSSVTIPSRVTSIGEQAFNYCSNLTSVYCKAVEPPLLGYRTFDGILDTAILYVPYESVEAYSVISGYADSFSKIRGINYSESDVEDITSSTATLKWIPDTAVVQYDINVYQETTHIAQYIVNGNGQIISSQRFAPSIYHQKLDTTVSSTEYFVISLDGLSAGTNYSYTIDGINAQSAPIYHEEGSFQTLNEDTEGLFDVILDDPRRQAIKIFRDGQIYILRGENVYTVTGQEVK